MRYLLAVILAAFLAAPLGAADRPVGPETGQARIAENPGSGGNHDDPDEVDRDIRGGNAFCSHPGREDHWFCRRVRQNRSWGGF